MYKLALAIRSTFSRRSSLLIKAISLRMDSSYSFASYALFSCSSLVSLALISWLTSSYRFLYMSSLTLCWYNSLSLFYFFLICIWRSCSLASNFYRFSASALAFKILVFFYCSRFRDSSKICLSCRALSSDYFFNFSLSRDLLFSNSFRASAAYSSLFLNSSLCYAMVASAYCLAISILLDFSIRFI